MSNNEDTIKKLASEVDYWKNAANKNQLKFESAHEELEEFQSGSRELEKELETQIEQLERQNRDLNFANQKLLMENESNRSKMQSMQLENSEQIDRLETELNRVTQERDEMQRYIRDLEQTNDDLERAKRAAVVSLEDFERRLNEAIERNAFLENELDEKDDLQTYVQRLKEETRDLRQELKVKDRIGTVTNNSIKENALVQRPLSLTLSNTIANGAALPLSKETTIDKGDHSKNSVNVPKEPTTPAAFTASTRISALNIVSDLLRKVGALETKLANSKRFSVDNAASYSALTPITAIDASQMLNNAMNSTTNDKKHDRIT